MSSGGRIWKNCATIEIPNEIERIDRDDVDLNRLQLQYSMWF